MNTIPYKFFSVRVIFLFVCLFVLGLHLWPMEVSRQGVKLEPQLLAYTTATAMPDPQIRAVSSTYTTTHGNTRSLTHWARPGIKLASLGMLVRFVSAEPWREPLRVLLNTHTYLPFNSIIPFCCIHLLLLGKIVHRPFCLALKHCFFVCDECLCSTLVLIFWVVNIMKQLNKYLIPPGLMEMVVFQSSFCSFNKVGLDWW